MPSIELTPLSGRYLSLAEREEIAILHAQQLGVREIARRGHSLENHTDTHPYCFPCFSMGAIAREVHRAQETITAIASRPPRLAGGLPLREAEDKLRRLDRNVELRALAHAVKLEPVGVREPVVEVASSGRGPG